MTQKPTLPAYRYGQLPDGLATTTMLRRMRRRPAPGQEPVGTLIYRRSKHAALFEIAASEELPALPAGRQAAWTAARTCARCAATSSTPWPLTYDSDRRRCPDCVGAERLAAARPSWYALRAQAVDWARDVLADPDSVLLALYRVDWGCPIEVHATTTDGQVLVDILVWPERTRPGLARTPGAIAADQIVPHLTPLVGARAIHLMAAGTLPGRFSWMGTPTDELEQASRHWWGHPGLGAPVIREHHDDRYEQRWTDWHARTRCAGRDLWPGHHGRPGLDQIFVTGESAADLTSVMRTGLVYMAQDKHPDGAPECPWLPPTGLTACGAPTGPRGLCPSHVPAQGPS